MANQNTKQYIPVFVGSTFEDLREYRAEVQRVLQKYETIVNGMEFFGSTPKTPIDECLQKVRESRIYIGIFAHRYGSIEEKSGKSFTHLEYDEAQRLKLPSLIYIIDDNQPVLPKHIDKGFSLEALTTLKSSLKKKHNLSTFTTSLDLATKVSQDLPSVLKQLDIINNEEEIDVVNQIANINDNFNLAKRFKLRPKAFKGRETVLCLSLSGGLWSVGYTRASALKLEAGDSIYCYTEVLRNIDDDKDSFSIILYAQKKQADELESIMLSNKDSIIIAKGIFIYGEESNTMYDVYEQDTKIVSGLLLSEIVEICK